MTKQSRGFLLIEALMSVTIFALMAVSVIPVIAFMFQRTAQSKYEQEASLLLQEGMEVAYNTFVADPTLATDGVYRPALEYVGPTSDDYQWTLESGAESNIKTRYNRSVSIEGVCRSSESGEIVPLADCSGTNEMDDKAKSVEGIVSWIEAGNERQLSAKLLVVDLQK